MKATLLELSDALGDRNIALCRELTKKFEEVRRTSLSEANKYYETHEPRGEYVIVLEGRDISRIAEEKAQDYRQMDINEHMAIYEAQGFDRKEAMKKVASDRNVSKRDIYRSLIEDEDKKRS